MVAEKQGGRVCLLLRYGFASQGPKPSLSWVLQAKI